MTEPTCGSALVGTKFVRTVSRAVGDGVAKEVDAEVIEFCGFVNSHWQWVLRCGHSRTERIGECELRCGGVLSWRKVEAGRDLTADEASSLSQWWYLLDAHQKKQISVLMGCTHNKVGDLMRSLRSDPSKIGKRARCTCKRARAAKSQIDSFGFAYTAAERTCDNPDCSMVMDADCDLCERCQLSQGSAIAAAEIRVQEADDNARERLWALHGSPFLVAVRPLMNELDIEMGRVDVVSPKLESRARDIVASIADSAGALRASMRSSVLWMLAHAGDRTVCGSHSRILLSRLESAGVRNCLPDLFQVKRLTDESLAAEAERAFRNAINDEDAGNE
jgi:hypothetical protein